MRRYAAIGAVLLTAGTVCASSEPHIGFAYPCGAQQGTAVEVEIGGQYFGGATNVFISGEGVTAEILSYSVKYEPRRVGQLFRSRENALALLADEDASAKSRAGAQKQLERAERDLALTDLPEGVDYLDRKAVQKLYRNTLNTKEQFNPQLQDRLRIRVQATAAAPPGERELRVYSPAGLSNPFYFEVGALPEVHETEPNDDHMSPELQTIPVPAMINGQIRPGDMDHFQFKAARGDSIVVDVRARRIIPYLADAVPGWFQAVAALYDADGNEVAYQDDYKFNPDPVLFFDVPESGVYTLSIRDSIYRGREDFIYRIAIGELPFITSVFPLGARAGGPADIALGGRNLPKTRLTGALPEESPTLRHVTVERDGYRSNPVPFAIGRLPEMLEQEPNDTAAQAQSIARPLTVNGRILQPGDRDIFAFKGAAGDSVTIDVAARRLGSPLDSVIALTGPGLEQPVRSDDYVQKGDAHLYLGAGLVTHHADSYLVHELPAAGTYFVEIADAQNQGGHDYGYRLSITRSAPDFALRLEPSGLQIAPGATAAFTVRAERKDGFDRKIKLRAAELPKGFVMSEAEIPKGADTARFTITAPEQIESGLVCPKIEGVGLIAGEQVIREAVPVDDQMQAFLYRHLVPAKELMLAPVETRPPVLFNARMPKSGVILMEAGQETRIPLEGHISGEKRGFSVSLDDPPEGFSTEKNGWIGKKRTKNKQRNDEWEEHEAVGSILISVDESVAPGTELSLVVQAEVKNGRETTYFCAPAIPVKVVGR